MTTPLFETPAVEWPVDLTNAERASARLLPITNRGGGTVYAVIDDELYPALSLYAWRVDHRGYVRRTTSIGPTRLTLMLHRVVMCCEPRDGLELDHINRCRLDNRRANLRYVTHAENMRNAAPPYSYTPRPDVMRPSGAQPCWDQRDRVWRARFQHTAGGLRIRHNVGSYKTRDEAADALAAAINDHMERGCVR